VNNSEKYLDYLYNDQFLEWEFFPAKCLNGVYYWVSFKNGDGEDGSFPYFVGPDTILPIGSGFTKPDNLEWPPLSKLHYDNFHPILCYNSKHKKWSWFSFYEPLFDDLLLEYPQKLIYRLLEPGVDSVHVWSGLNQSYWENTGWNLEPLFDTSLYNMNDSIEFADDEPPKVEYEQYVTRMVIDVHFKKDELHKPYGYKGEFDCGTVQDILNDLKKAGRDVRLLSCVTNAATTIDSPNKEALHPALRESRGEIDV